MLSVGLKIKIIFQNQYDKRAEMMIYFKENVGCNGLFVCVKLGIFVSQVVHQICIFVKERRIL